MTPYEILGIELHVDNSFIKKAYRALVMMWHPDRPDNKDKPEVAEEFLRIQRAYEFLSDPIQRAAYDANPWDFDAEPADQSLMTQRDAALENEARDLLASIFNRHVDKLSIVKAKKFDMDKTIRAELNDGVRQMRNLQKQCYPIAMKLNVVRHRLSPTPYLHQVLKKKRLANIASWTAARWQQQIAYRALAILCETSYQADPDDFGQPYTGNNTVVNVIDDNGTRPLVDFLHQRRTSI